MPGPTTALAHPQQVYLPEDLVTPAVNRWIGQLFDPVKRDETVTTLLAADWLRRFLSMPAGAVIQLVISVSCD